MTKVPLGLGTYRRDRADMPQIRLRNLFYEEDPTNQVDGVALLRRPGMRPMLEAGTGPGRYAYWQSGFANDDLFVVSGEEIFRVTYTANSTYTATAIPGTIGPRGTPSLAARTDYLFVSDGASLWYTDGAMPLTTIDVPDDNGIGSIDVLFGYIFCTVAGVGTLGDAGGRFYWIEPGEITIDPLNFATAESKPDIVKQCKTVGDQIWMFGDKSTEPWYLTGDPNAPVAPVQGRAFDRGSLAGTAVLVDESVILVGRDGRVYDVSGGAQPISNPGVEERILNAIKRQTQEIL